MSTLKNFFSREKKSDELKNETETTSRTKVSEQESEVNIESDKQRSKEELEKQSREKIKKIESDQPSGSPSQAALSSPQIQVSKSINMQKIEKIMEEDIDEIYFSMDHDHRRLFKEEGERTAREIEKVILIGKSVAVKVLELIKRWLRLIPGVNKFFLEQEAKIKTDKIIKSTIKKE